MLVLCFAVLGAAVLLGAVLASGRARRLAAVHGVFGAVGTVGVGLALRGGAFAGGGSIGSGVPGGASAGSALPGSAFAGNAFPGVSAGGPFAWDAFGLLVAALAGGLGLAFVWRRDGRPASGTRGLVVFLHAWAGGLATLLLAGFVFGR